MHVHGMVLKFSILEAYNNVQIGFLLPMAGFGAEVFGGMTHVAPVDLAGGKQVQMPLIQAANPCLAPPHSDDRKPEQREPGATPCGTEK